MQATKTSLMLCDSSVAAPILAICCGHLLDDLQDEDRNTEEGICAKCGLPHDHTNQYTSEQAPKLRRTWHRMFECTADENQQMKVAVFETTILDIATENTEYLTKIRTLFESLHKGPRNGQRFKMQMVQLLIDPAGTCTPPPDLHARLLQAVAAFLTPRTHRLRGGDEEEEAASAEDQTRQSEQEKQPHTKRSKTKAKRKTSKTKATIRKALKPRAGPDRRSRKDQTVQHGDSHGRSACEEAAASAGQGVSA